MHFKLSRNEAIRVESELESYHYPASILVMNNRVGQLGLPEHFRNLLSVNV